MCTPLLFPYNNLSLIQTHNPMSIHPTTEDNWQPQKKLNWQPQEIDNWQPQEKLNSY